MDILEKRMYFFVNYQLMGIQKGIQAGHAAVEYALQFSNSEEFIEFSKNHKTWIALNGGTTNDSEDPELCGSMQTLYKTIQDYNQKSIENFISVAKFHEPDLNNAMTAICFICDQRVWDRKLVPDFTEYCERNLTHTVTDEELFPDWLKLMGGDKNVVLRNLITGKKFA